MRMKKRFFYGAFLCAMALLASCGGTNNRFKEVATTDPDAVQINFVRFDQLIYGLDSCITRPAYVGNDQYDLMKVDIPDDDSLCLKQKIEVIKGQYPTQFRQYMTMLTEMSSGYETSYETLFYLFLVHQAYHDVFNECEKRYEHTEDIQRQFTKSFSRATQLIPGYQTPENIHLIYSGFGNYLALDENTLYVSLEYFLGADYANYAYAPGVFQYQIKNMTREKIVPDAIYECTCEQFPMTKEAGNLLDYLIYYGKMLYVTDAIMQEDSPKRIMGYTDDEWAWCEANEKKMWNFLREENLLFETDNKMITDFTIMSGATKYFSTEQYSAPGRAAVWLGWQIVSKYMERNSSLSLADLLAQQDAQMILNGSRYNP